MSPSGFPTTDESGATVYMCPCLCHSGVLSHVVACACPCMECGEPVTPGTAHTCHQPAVKEPLEERRAQVLEHWQRAQERLILILFEEDPASLVFEADVQADEYELEATEILPRLLGCQTEEDARSLIHQKLTQLIGSAAPESVGAYSKVAHRVWLEVVPVLREGGIQCSTSL